MIKRFDAFMIKLVMGRGWRWGVSVLYSLLIAWHLWDVVHQNPFWGIDYASTIVLTFLWGAMAWMWGRKDRCDEIERLVVAAVGDPRVASYAWLWASGRPAWQQHDVIVWLHTHRLTATHVDDMPPAVRDLANMLVLLRS